MRTKRENRTKRKRNKKKRTIGGRRRGGKKAASGIPYMCVCVKAWGLGCLRGKKSPLFRPRKLANDNRRVVGGSIGGERGTAGERGQTIQFCIPGRIECVSNSKWMVDENSRTMDDPVPLTSWGSAADDCPMMTVEASCTRDVVLTAIESVNTPAP